jgi:hypothetical protein
MAHSKKNQTPTPIRVSKTGELRGWDGAGTARGKIRAKKSRRRFVRREERVTAVAEVPKED